MRIVAGKHRGKVLLSPPDDSIRPTSDRAREAIFSMIGSRLGPHLDGIRVLDLFAGTGALGLEALSRGAAALFLVDTGSEAPGLIRDHVEAVGAGGVAKRLRRDATSLGPAGTLGPFHLVFLDPPYGKGLGEKALAALVTGNWLAPDALIVFEEGVGSEVTLPPGYVEELRRDYGAACVRLLRFSPGT